MARMTNFRSYAVATGNAINDSSYDNVMSIKEHIDNINNVGNSIDKVDNVSDNMHDINTVVSDIPSINIVADSISNVNSVSGIISDVSTVADINVEVQDVSNNMSNIVEAATRIMNYGPLSIQPTQGTHKPNTSPAEYYDLQLGDLYFDKNINKQMIYVDNGVQGVWAVNASGQFADVGTEIGKGIQFMAQVSGVEDIVIPNGTNAFTINNFTLSDGASITVEGSAVYKVI